MKLLLQILWGWSVLANGAVGIQVGTIQTNNQNIKLMKMNFNNPAWLQGASNVGGDKEYISFVDATGSPNLYQLSARGNVTIQSIYNGEPTSQIVTDPIDASVQIQSDANTEVILYGKITKLVCDPGPGGSTHFSSIDLTQAKSLTHLDCGSNQLTSLDVSNNAALTVLDCGPNQLTSLDVSNNAALNYLYCNFNQLTSLDVSNNAALTHLDCGFNGTLTTIDGIGVHSSVATSIASAITKATSVDGTVTLRQGDEFNQTIIDAAMEKGWDVQYRQ